MYCAECGEELPAGANFCPSCGSPVPNGDAGRPSGGDATTAAIDIGVFDDQESVAAEGLDLPAGTGMLVVVRGPNAGSRYLIDQDFTTVGRHPDSHIFLDDVTVSRRHAEIHRRDDGILAHDLGSLNGTYVNGERVDDKLLSHGDEVQIGRFKFMFVGAGS